MGLLSGDLAAVFSSAFSGIYLDGTLHRAALTDDGQGGGSSTFTDQAVKAQLDATTQAMQRSDGYVDTDQRILVLAFGVDTPTADDEITVRGQRWKIASVALDPAQAAYELRGRKA